MPPIKSATKESASAEETPIGGASRELVIGREIEGIWTAGGDREKQYFGEIKNEFCFKERVFLSRFRRRLFT